MKTKKIFPFLFFLLILSDILSVNAQSQLHLTVTTDHFTYTQYEMVSVSGNLQYGAISPADGLVALQITDPAQTPIVVRTLRTGMSQPFVTTATVTEAYLSDLRGAQQSSVQIGTIPYFKVSVRNNDDVLRYMLITVNVYDSNAMVIGQTYQTAQVPAHTAEFFIFGMATLSTSVHSGIAYAYANIYSDWPQNGGIPYSLEQSFSFSIIGGAQAGSGQSPIISASGGSYSYTFRLPKNSVDGTYSVSTAAAYDNPPVTATASTTFQVNLIGDLDNDESIGYSDIVLFVDAYIKFYQEQSWNQFADMNQDGIMSYSDIVMFVNYYVIFWST
jgi:hypothetical protein